MPRIRYIAPSLLLVVFSSTLAWAADPPAFATLKKKGLARSGRYFVLDAEQSIIEQWQRARPALAGYAAAAARRDEADQAAQDLARLAKKTATVSRKKVRSRR